MKRLKVQVFLSESEKRKKGGVWILQSGHVFAPLPSVFLPSSRA